MKWIKRGLIFDNGDKRAQMPTALVMDDKIRIYYNIRDKKQRSRTYFIDVDKDNPSKILYIHKKEVLPLGERGAFDDAGVMPSYVHWHQGNVRLYYVGFSLAKDVPYKCFIGAAESTDNGMSFPLIFKVREETRENLLATTPTEGGFYAKGIRWIDVGGKLEPIYLIQRGGIVCIRPKTENEANCRPTIIHHDKVFKMWFCYRDSFDFRGGKGSYRIGYAESKTGLMWERDDKKAGITIGKKGEFDSEMLCYPNIVRVGYKYYMFYNGNGFGKSGFGWAEARV